MSEQPSNAPGQSTNPPKNRRRRWAIAGIVTALLGALGVVGLTRAQGGEYGHCHRWHGAMDPERAGERIDSMVSYMLDNVQANPEQKQRVAEIAKGALSDLKPLREQHNAARSQAIELLKQQSIDRAALEQLRAEELQLAEAASKRVTQALADAAEVLSPEQRAKLAEHWQKRRRT